MLSSRLVVGFIYKNKYKVINNEVGEVKIRKFLRNISSALQKI